MSQPVVEAALGRLICDDEFRREFFQNPHRAVERQGLALTEIERTSLARLSEREVTELAEALDDRIRRAGPL